VALKDFLFYHSEIECQAKILPGSHFHIHGHAVGLMKKDAHISMQVIGFLIIQMID
jgi:hypothetical protein